MGTGGMTTKIIAAKIAKKAKAHTVIASSTDINVLRDILKGEEVGTWFKN